MQVLLSVIDSFPWSLSVLLMVVAAMLIFRRALSELISRSREVSAGPFRLKAEHAVNPKFLEEALREVREGAASIEQQVDTRRLVIRDAQGRPRILASTLEPLGAAFLAIFDEDGEARASLVASSASDQSGVALLLFPGKGRPPGDMASMIGAEMDGSGTVGVRNSSGAWKEMS